MLKLKLIFAISILLFLMTSCNEKNTDEDIQENVTKQLKDNKKYTGVNFTVKDKVVTLTGMCEGDNCAADIEIKVNNINGVEKVINNTTSNNSTDFTLRTSVQSIIIKYPGVQADVADGNVVLRGNIDGVILPNLMSNLAALHPKKIDNQLLIK